MKKIKISSDVDYDLLANMTPGMVGADLANLVNEAALLAVRRNKKEVGLAEFEEAVERIIAGLEKKNRLINPRERETVALPRNGTCHSCIIPPGYPIPFKKFPSSPGASPRWVIPCRSRRKTGFL